MSNSLATLDQNIFFLLHNQAIQSPLIWKLAMILRNPWTWLPLYILMAFWLVLKKGKKTFLQWGILSLILFGSSELLTVRLLKPTIARLRPCHEFPDKVSPASPCGGLYSFPSTHATTHMGLAIFWATFLAHKLIKIALIIWAVFIGIAQIIVGVHYPGDIVAGWLLGALLAAVINLAYKAAKGYYETHQQRT